MKTLSLAIVAIASLGASSVAACEPFWRSPWGPPAAYAPYAYYYEPAPVYIPVPVFTWASPPACAPVCRPEPAPCQCGPSAPAVTPAPAPAFGPGPGPDPGPRGPAVLPPIPTGPSASRAPTTFLTAASVPLPGELIRKVNGSFSIAGTYRCKETFRDEDGTVWSLASGGKIPQAKIGQTETMSVSYEWRKVEGRKTLHAIVALNGEMRAFTRK